MRIKWNYKFKDYFLIISLAIMSYLYYSKDAKLKINFPHTSSVISNTSFACESLMSSNIIGSSEKYLIDGIEGEVLKGTDKVAMKIQDRNTLIFSTAASIGIGMAEGDKFIILKNDEERLMAVWFNDNAINSIALNKNNGLAVWSKGNPDFMLHGAPFGQTIYLHCR